ncbi:putative Autotransporter beta-domain protein [uncultured Defluviicoccus sp.]|uniref:Putative Autotransporter beta-domain protein n=1 Tax=metagenome TaxID=256318 RepID=A0A380TFQ6_9ZZZZ|nr:putative Autotransporter beta-domain protein [uncultured Defluviicoccus sp.]
MIKHLPRSARDAGRAEECITPAFRLSCRLVCRRDLAFCALVVAGGVLALPAESGQTFNEATTNQLRFFSQGNCGLTKSGTALNANCTSGFLPGGEGSASNGSASSSVSSPAALAPGQERIRVFRERQGKSGGSADTSIGLGQGFSLFVAPGYERLSHSNNAYEDGYASDIGGVTVGGDYQFNTYLLAGLAFSYRYQDARYDDGGGFNTSDYGLTVYGSVLPVDNAFIDVAAGYGWQKSNETRVGRLFNNVGVNYAKARLRSDYTGDRLTAGVIAGYDQPIDNINVGPRIGFNATHQEREPYHEKGGLGLPLEYQRDSQTSLQSSLGAAASMAVSTTFGVLLPQIEAAWVHEFANDQRGMKARFRQSTAQVGNFRYDSESPDRNFGIIGVGLTAVLPNGLQPFMAFRSIVGNDNYNSYAVSAGLRLEL